MDIKVINQIKSKDDFQEPIIIKNFDLNNSVKELKKRIYEELKLKNPINNLGLFYTTKEKERKNKISYNLKQSFFSSNYKLFKSIIF